MVEGEGMEKVKKLSWYHVFPLLIFYNLLNFK